MSTTRAIAHNTAIQIIGKAVSTILGLVLFAMITRGLGVEKFGWYTTAYGFMQFIGILTDFGFTVSTANMLSEPAHDKKRLLNSLFFWRLITAVIFQGFGSLFILLLPYGAPIKIAAIILSVSFITSSLNQVFTGYFVKNLRTWVVSIGEASSKILMLAGIYLAIRFGWDFLPQVIVLTLANVAFTIFLWLKSDGAMPWPDWSLSRAIWQKISPTALSVIFNSFYLQGGKLLLPLFVSQTEVGMFGASYRVIEIALQIAAIVMGIITPLAAYSWSHHRADEFAERYRLGFEAVSFVMLPMAFGILALSEGIIALAAGKEFVAAGPYLALLIISLFGSTFGMAFGHMALAINKQSRAIWIYASCAILSFPAYFILIPMFGARGAIFVTIGSEIYAGLSLFLFCSYYTRVMPRFWQFAKTFFSALGMGALVYFTRHLMPLPLSILLGIIAYTFLALILGIIKKETLREIISAKKIAELPEI